MTVHFDKLSEPSDKLSEPIKGTLSLSKCSVLSKLIVN